MQLAHFMQRKWKVRSLNDSDEKAATGTYSNNERAELVIFEMTLHVPRRIAVYGKYYHILSYIANNIIRFGKFEMQVFVTCWYYSGSDPGTAFA